MRKTYTLFGIEDYKNNIKNEQVLSKEFSRIINNYLKKIFYN